MEKKTSFLENALLGRHSKTQSDKMFVTTAYRIIITTKPIDLITKLVS